MADTNATSALGVAVQPIPELREREAPRFWDPPSGLHVAAAAAAVFVGYYVGARIGLMLRCSPAGPSFLWLPNAILTAVLLLAPARRGWIYLLAALPGHLLAQLEAGRPLALALALFATNCGEALVAFAVLRRSTDQPVRFDTLRRTAVFVGAALLAPFLSAYADPGLRALLQDASYWPAWRTQFHGNVLAQLALVPPIVTAVSLGWAGLRRVFSARGLEAAALALALVAVGVFVLVGPGRLAIGPPGFPATGRIFFLPLLLWAAVRFGPAGVSLSLLNIALIALWAAARGNPSFANLPSAEGALALQSLLIVVGIPILCVGALVEERRVAATHLEDRLRFEELLSRITGAFVRVPSDQMDAAFETSLARIGEYTGVDRVALFRLGAQEMECDYSWKAPGREQPMQVLAREEWPWHLHRLEREETIAYSRPEELPAEAAPERDRLQALGVMSHLVIPVKAGGPILGGLSLATTAAPCAWSPGLVQRLRLVAVALASALARKETEDALRASELMKSAILASLTSAVAVLDREGRIIAVNEGWSWRGGPSSGWARPGVGVNYLAICRRAVAEGDAEVRGILAGIEGVLDGSQETFALEYPCATPTGDRWFFMQVLPLHRPQGGAIVSHTDTTERKHAEAEAERSRQELAHFLRVSTMGIMATSLAHELNQPLAAIMANAQAARLMLGTSRPNLDELREILTDVVEEDKRAGEVIGRLRELLKKGEPERVPLNLNALVREVARLVNSDALIRRIGVRLELDPGTPIVRADRVQVQQVILNLVLNALEAMAEGPADNRMVLVRTEKGPREVRLSVDDGGNGLGDGGDRVFEPFYTTKPAGMGMGLSIARSIILAHGGTIWATNNPVRGATFSFTLPLVAARPG